MEPRLYVSESNAALFRCSLQRNTVHGQTPVLEKTSCINNVPLYMIYVPISTQLKLEAIKQFFPALYDIISQRMAYIFT